MEIENQIRQVLEQQGMSPESIRYNDSLDWYSVNIGVEGSDEEFVEDVYGLGSEEPIDETVDTDAVKRHIDRIGGASIPGGKIEVVSVMRDEHFTIRVVEE